MSSKPFLVAGGGIAGLASAIAIAKAGHEARLFEQAGAFEEVGAGVQMSPNAVLALRAIGAWDAVAPHCVIPTEIHVRDGLSGTLLQRVRLGKMFEQRFGAPYRVIHRADLLAGLLTVARQDDNIDLATSQEVVGAASSAEGATLRFAGSGPVAGRAVIGADGLRSVIRTAVLGGGPARPQGHTLYRALLPFASVPRAIAGDCITLWLLPGAHVVHYPVSNWRNFNVVAAVEEDWRAESWSTEGAPGDLVPWFGDSPPSLQDLVAAVPQWLKWRGADIDRQLVWARGNIAIVGDAAHATLPYLAQGAAMSLEDAAILGSCISRSNLVSDALTEFVSRRQHRTARIQAQSRTLAHTYHHRGAMRMARNTMLRLMPPGTFLGRLAWIYNWRP